MDCRCGCIKSTCADHDRYFSLGDLFALVIVCNHVYQGRPFAGWNPGLSNFCVFLIALCGSIEADQFAVYLEFQTGPAVSSFNLGEDLNLLEKRQGGG